MANCFVGVNWYFPAIFHWQQLACVKEQPTATCIAILSADDDSSHVCFGFPSSQAEARERSQPKASLFQSVSVSSILFRDRRRHRFYAHGLTRWFLRQFNTLLSQIFFFAAQLHKIRRVALSFTSSCDRVTSFSTKKVNQHSKRSNIRGFWTLSWRLVQKKQTQCDRWENELKWDHREVKLRYATIIIGDKANECTKSNLSTRSKTNKRN